jgi:hypothetical protein
MQAILPLADHFHQLFIVVSRAFVPAFRRGRFDPLAKSLRSFTPRLLTKGPPKPDFLPLVAHRVAPPTCRFLPFGPSSTVPGSAYLLLRLSALECLTSLTDGMDYYALC